MKDSVLLVSPVIGALFRSTAFQKDQTELVFVVTPRLVQPIAQALLPTDLHREPSRQDALIGGKAEAGAAPVAPTPVQKSQSTSSQPGSKP